MVRPRPGDTVEVFEAGQWVQARVLSSHHYDTHQGQGTAILARLGGGRVVRRSGDERKGYAWRW